MALIPMQPITEAMKRAGAAVLSGSPNLSKEDLATAVYRAMAEAESGSRAAQDEVAAAAVLDGGGDERKKRAP